MSRYGYLEVFQRVPLDRGNVSQLFVHQDSEQPTYTLCKIWASFSALLITKDHRCLCVGSDESDQTKYFFVVNIFQGRDGWLFSYIEAFLCFYSIVYHSFLSIFCSLETLSFLIFYKGMFYVFSFCFRHKYQTSCGNRYKSKYWLKWKAVHSTYSCSSDSRCSLYIYCYWSFNWYITAPCI